MRYAGHTLRTAPKETALMLYDNSAAQLASYYLLANALKTVYRAPPAD